jgi:hypothetical protein
VLRGFEAVEKITHVEMERLAGVDGQPFQDRNISGYQDWVPETPNYFSP